MREQCIAWAYVGGEGEGAVHSLGICGGEGEGAVHSLGICGGGGGGSSA